MRGDFSPASPLLRISMAAMPAVLPGLRLFLKRIVPKPLRQCSYLKKLTECLTSWMRLTMYTPFSVFARLMPMGILLLDGTRFPLLRQQIPHPDGSPFLCLSDFVRPLASGTPDTVGIFAASCDGEVELLYEEDPYKRMLVQTLADRLAEAATEKMHEYVRKVAWGYAKDENLSIPELLKEKFQGIRPAVGYPSLPDQSVNFLLNELLHMEQIGITLTENGAMRPHATVCGLMLAHPAARYFAVGKIGNDQLEDYARRRRMPINEVRKFLAANL